MSFSDFAELARKGKQDQNGVRYYTRTFECMADNTGESWVTASNAVLTNFSIDLYGSYNDGTTTDSIAYAKNIQAEEDNEFRKWKVVIDWDTAANKIDDNKLGVNPSGSAPPAGATTPGSGNNQVSPELRPIEIKWDAIQREELFEIDEAATPVLNSAGDPFVPAPVVRRPACQVTLTFYKTAAAYSKIVTYIGSVNDATWTAPWGEIVDAKCALCTNYKIQSVTEHAAVFFKYEVMIEISAIPYNPLKILDAGTRYKPSVSLSELLEGTVVRNLPIASGKGGGFVTHPVPLSGGLPIGPTDDPVYLEFEAYIERDFDSLY